MSRPSWWHTMTFYDDVAWMIPYDVMCTKHAQNHYACDCRPPQSPWVHSSYARGWPRCPVCRAPFRPGDRCTHWTGHVIDGQYKAVPHYDYPTYAAVAQRVEPLLRKQEEPVQVRPVAPTVREETP